MRIFYFSFFIASSFFLSSFAVHAAYTPLNRPIHVTHYKIMWEIDPSTNPDTFDASVEISLTTMKELKEFDLDIHELQIKKVLRLLGPKKTEELQFQIVNGNSLLIKLPDVVAEQTKLVLLIDYSGKIQVNEQMGLFKSVDPDDASRGAILSTHFEANGARAFFPCNDEPADKATSEIVTTVPAQYEVISNGKIIKDRQFKKGDALWRERHWSLDKPHSTYLNSVAIGIFEKISKKYGPKDISIWTGKLGKNGARQALDATEKTMKFFEQYFGVRYPWPKYDSVAIPMTHFGGMENISATHMKQANILLVDPESEYRKRGIVGLVAHELAHQWFGDYVTMRWWDELWLNESFATYFGLLGELNFFKNEEPMVFEILRTWQSYCRQEDGPRSHPIVNHALENSSEAFDNISYVKGENVLRMLSFFVGESKFKKGLKDYLKKHAYSNASYTDFFASMEKESGEKLDSFRDSWLLQRGYPVIRYSGSWDAKKSSYTLTLGQRSNHVEDKSALFTFRLPVVFHRKSEPAYTKAITVLMDKAEHSVETDGLLAEPEWVTVDPEAIVLAKLEPVKFDESRVALQALNDPDPVSRLWAGKYLIKNFKEGKDEEKISALAQKTFVEMLQHDSSPYVRVALLGLFGDMKKRWLPIYLADAVFDLAKDTCKSDYEKGATFLSDVHGWREWRSKLLGTLGQVRNDEVQSFLEKRILDPALPLDQLGEVARSIAKLGDDKTAGILKKALDMHSSRGYAYRIELLFAFGSYENVKAVDAIRDMAQTTGPDVMGKIEASIDNNQTLKNSSEWCAFLKDFILNDKRFGDSVKADLLETIEEVKTDQVRALLEVIMKESQSAEVKTAAAKILKANFGK